MHRFPLQVGQQRKITRHQLYNGWSLFNYTEWQRTHLGVSGEWKHKILATDGDSILYGEGGNIRKQVDDRITENAHTDIQMGLAVAGLEVTEVFD